MQQQQPQRPPYGAYGGVPPSYPTQLQSQPQSNPHQQQSSQGNYGQNPQFPVSPPTSNQSQPPMTNFPGPTSYGMPSAGSQGIGSMAPPYSSTQMAPGMPTFRGGPGGQVPAPPSPYQYQYQGTIPQQPNYGQSQVPPPPISPNVNTPYSGYGSQASVGGMAGYQGGAPFNPIPKPTIPGPNLVASPPVPAAAPQASSQQPKISSAQMPNVVTVQEADQARFDQSAPFRTTMVSEILPPLPTTDVPIIDDGNCSPHFMRMTTYHLPISEELQQSSKVPVAMIIQPFANSPDSPVPVVDFSEKGPIRCTRCRSYLNLFVKFLRGGRSFECNICSMVNEVPEEYFCNLDASGRRMDISQRPELLYGSFDIVASKEYAMRKAEQPYLLFAIDASRGAIQNGAFSSALQAIKSVVTAHVQGTKLYAKMAIITFDKSINIYDLRADEPQILVMSDILEPFVPLSEGLFFDPVKSYDQIISLLDRLPLLYGESRIVDSCFGAAAMFAYEAMKKHGGRCVLFNTSLPNVGSGVLRSRDAAVNVTADKVSPLILPQGDFYSKLGKEASSNGVSYVLVSTPTAFADIATIGQLSNATSGKIFYYPKFGSDLSGRPLVADLYKFLFKPFVFDSVLRVRAGSSLQVSEYYGNYTTLNQTDYQFAALDCDQSFACTFIYDAKLAENERVSFQCAILHTTSTGQRRIRVHNLCLPVASSIANVFRMADLDSYLIFNTKFAVNQIPSLTIGTIMNHFHIKSAQVLGSYRKHCATNMPTGQLVLPESLKLLPIFCLAASKTPAFCTAQVPIDERMASLYNLSSMSMSHLITYYYPRLIPLHRLLEQSESNALRLSKEFIEPQGIYLLENPDRIFLWIGDVADPEVLSKLFGVAQLMSISTIVDTLPELNNPLSAMARQIINDINDKYSRQLPLVIVRHGIDPMEVEWQNLLVEDGQGNVGPSYVDFLCRLHNQINHEMTSSSLAERTALLSFLQ